jgi:excisionase family DNA binding protein
MSTEALLTIDQAAERLRIPKSWFYGRIHARTLPFPHVKVGHYVRIPEAGLARYIELATVQPGDTP